MERARPSRKYELSLWPVAACTSARACDCQSAFLEPRAENAEPFGEMLPNIAIGTTVGGKPSRIRTPEKEFSPENSIFLALSALNSAQLEIAHASRLHLTQAAAHQNQ